MKAVREEQGRNADNYIIDSFEEAFRLLGTEPTIHDVIEKLPENQELMFVVISIATIALSINLELQEEESGRPRFFQDDPPNIPRSLSSIPTFKYFISGDWLIDILKNNIIIAMFFAKNGALKSDLDDFDRLSKRFLSKLTSPDFCEGRFSRRPGRRTERRENRSSLEKSLW